jgi:HlyD family secretion protein
VLQDRANLEVARSNVTVQQAGIDRAEANLRKARLEYERAEPLSRRGTLSASEFDAALAAFESARADLTMARAQLQNAQAVMAQREASLESSEIDLERTRIRSPIDGVVIERAVDQGQTVAASFSSPTLFLIAQDLSQIQIEANVDEADIGNVRAGNPASFTVDAYPNDEFTGLVEQVRLAPNEQNNVVTYTVIVTADNPGQKLLPGMTAIVEIVTGKSEDVLRVPNQALRFSPPADSPLAGQQATAGADAPGAGGGGRRGLDPARLAEQLGLSDAQASAVEQDMTAILQDMRSQMQAGGDRDLLRAQMQQKMASVMRKHLDAGQYARYEEQQRQRAETRSGQVWVQGEDGVVRPVTVRFGISDDTHTQIVGRGPEEGALVVTRMRRLAPD